MKKKEHNIPEEILNIPEGILRKSLEDYCDLVCNSKEINEVTKTAPFICDGFADEKTYTDLKGPKVLFIGKEPHHLKEGQSSIICKQSNFEKFEDWAYKPFYQNLMFYYYAIKKSLLSDQDNQNNFRFTFESNLIENPNKVEDQKKLFKELAFINIKKWDTNESSSNDCVIWQYAKAYKDPLREQIKAIDPDIIFLCGTDIAFREIFEEQEINLEKDDDQDFNNLSYLDDKYKWFYFVKLNNKTKLVINYYHPSLRAKIAGWIHLLAVQNILSNAITYIKAHKGDEDFKSLLERLTKSK